MKKLLALIMALVMLLPLCACAGSNNKKAFGTAKEVYENLDAAYEIISNFSHDLYESWRMGIYNDDDDNFGLAYLAKELNLSEDELKMGMAYTLNEDDWSTMSDEDRQSSIDSANIMFRLGLLTFDSSFSLCTLLVVKSYEITGKTDIAQAYLNVAKAQLRELSENYSDYEYYPTLRDYYTAVTAYFDLCQSGGSGLSFNQLKTTEEDYQKRIRDYKSGMSFVFED